MKGDKRRSLLCSILVVIGIIGIIWSINLIQHQIFYSDRIDSEYKKFFIISIMAGTLSAIITSLAIMMIYVRNAKRINLRLNESSQRAHSANQFIEQMAESMSSGLLAYRLPDREIILANKEALRIYDLDTYAEANKMDFYGGASANVLAEDSEEIKKAIRQIKKPGDFAAYEYHVKHKDKTVLTVLAHTKMIETANGERIVLSSIIDITHKAKLSAMAAFDKNQFREALMYTTSLAVMFDVTDGMLYRENIIKLGVSERLEIFEHLPVLFDNLIDMWMTAIAPKPVRGPADVLNCAKMKEAYERGEKAIEIDFLYDDRYYRVHVILAFNKIDGHLHAGIYASDITQEHTLTV